MSKKAEHDIINKTDLGGCIVEKKTKSGLSYADLKKLWSFEKNEDGTLCITGYKGKDIDVIVPECIGKNIVTEIACEAFSPLKWMRKEKQGMVLCGINSIVIPNTVRNIASRAFRGCYNLKTISLPNGLKSIGERAFAKCDKLQSISIPKSVESIGKEAFDECVELSDICLPDEVKNIEENAFKGCYGLADDNDCVIIRNVLYNCYRNQESIVIPQGVTHITDNVFIKVLNKPYKIEMSLKNLPLIRQSFKCCVKNVIIPDSVTFIDQHAFWGSTNLTIHASAGSYAEQYAKENNITFVAE